MNLRRQLALLALLPVAMSQRYIVVFKDGVSQEQIERYVQNVNNNGGHVVNRYEDILNGFSAHIPDSFFQSLQGDDLIDYIEPDSVVTTQ